MRSTGPHLPIFRPSNQTKLEPADWKIIELVVEGLKAHEIATRIGRSESGTKQRITRIYLKVGLNNRVELALWAVKREHEILSPSTTPETAGVAGASRVAGVAADRVASHA